MPDAETLGAFKEIDCPLNELVEAEKFWLVGFSLLFTPYFY